MNARPEVYAFAHRNPPHHAFDASWADRRQARNGNSLMKRVLVRCGWLVTLDPAIGDFKNGELLFRGNRIEAVGRNLGATPDQVIEAGDKIVMPGLVNAH